ncbi:MAG: type III-B CRISPR module RAMP protein Cmr4 [Anaerolineae bacterium]|nr:type III-B CRISPR module RAMP protein Cmr4 [Anaerolineae bacterium]
MFEAQRMLFIYVETPLHAGTGRGLGAVDLPIQRERTTGYPMVQASSLKGRLRAEAKGKLPDDNEHLAIFGPDTGNASDHAGALSVGDARILLFPVRSLAGVLAWTTSVDALARFQRSAKLAGLDVAWDLPPEPDADAAWISGDALKAGGSVVLEEFSFTPDSTHAALIQIIGDWLAQKALPQTSEYRYWREALPKKLCILPENAFRDFVRYGTEVQTHIKLVPDTKTVQDGALWTSESLPVDTLLYAPLLATKSRTDKADLDGKAILDKVAAIEALQRTQLGGDETTGQGMVALTFAGGAE